MYLVKMEQMHSDVGLNNEAQFEGITYAFTRTAFQNVSAFKGMLDITSF